MFEIYSFGVRRSIYLAAFWFLWSGTDCVAAAQSLDQADSKSANVKVERNSESPASDPRIVDVKQMVSFSLNVSEDKAERIEFKGLGDDVASLKITDSHKISELLVPLFKAPEPPKGVVIRVAKNVKFPMVDALYGNIRTVLQENEIIQPVYIAVDEPQEKNEAEEKQKEDEVRTQEFICEVKKASDLYDRVANVAKVLNVSVRLDPSRNSITAKGPSRKVTAIKNLINFLDKGEVGPAEENKPGVDNRKTAGLPRPNNPPGNSKKPEQTPGVKPPGGNEPPRGRDDPPRIDSGSVRAGDMRSGGLPAVKNSQQVVGRFQLSGIGNNLFLLDTATGDCWFLDATGESMLWVKLPVPPGR